jgi:hypothetical protein
MFVTVQRENIRYSKNEINKAGISESLEEDESLELSSSLLSS